MNNKSLNDTVLGVASLTKTLPVVGLVLVLLFVLVKPESTAGLGFFSRAVFWFFQIGFGLLGIVLASLVLKYQYLSRLPVLVRLFLTGLLGAALLAPVYLTLESLLPNPIAEEPDDWLDFFAQKGIVQALVAEFIEVTPVFLVAWLAVNLPLYLSEPIADGPGDKGPDGGGTPANGVGNATESVESDINTFFGLLPNVVGTDIVALSSDLHYLHVHTTLGKCMVLFNLKDAVEELGDAGMQVHRSHWVAWDHVVRLVKSGEQWQCEMDNGVRVPVSRRKKSAVTQHFGSGATVVSIAKRRRSGGV